MPRMRRNRLGQFIGRVRANYRKRREERRFYRRMGYSRRGLRKRY